jgi:hypothetical protein
LDLAWSTRRRLSRKRSKPAGRKRRKPAGSWIYFLRVDVRIPPLATPPGVEHVPKFLDFGYQPPLKSPLIAKFGDQRSPKSERRSHKSAIDATARKIKPYRATRGSWIPTIFHTDGFAFAIGAIGDLR